MKQCTTHHYACDCREAAHKEEVAALRALVGDLVEVIESVWDVYEDDHGVEALVAMTKEVLG